MLCSLLLAAGFACACLLTATSASAQIVFTLNNVSLGVPTTSPAFTAAGSLTGTFTTSSSTISKTTTLSSWSIVAPATTGTALSHNFAGFTYNPSDSTAYYNVGGNGLLTGFELDSPLNSNSTSQLDSIRFYFATPLSASGPITLNTITSGTTSSYESEHNSGGNRDVVSGTVAAAPEPSSWMMGLRATALFAGLCLHFRSSRA